MPSDMFSIKINLELWTLQTTDRTSRTGDQPCRKASTYKGQQRHRINADRHPCLELSQCPFQ
jgi:hypothetical protein